MTASFRTGLALLTLGTLLTVTGCGSIVSAPYTARPVSSRARAVESWAKVLGRYVDDQGRTDFKGLSKHPEDLEELENYVRFVASESPMTHPKKYPSPEDRMAYYLNSYNALAMYGVIQNEIPASFQGTSAKLNFFALKRYELGGPSLTLSDYENQVIRKAGDERVHFALNCMVKGCPRLPRKPFVPTTVKSELERLATEFLNERRNVEVDTSAKTVRFSEILKFYTPDFLRRAPSLIAYANLYRKEKIPADYTVGFIPYDWTINQKP